MFEYSLNNGNLSLLSEQGVVLFTIRQNETLGLFIDGDMLVKHGPYQNVKHFFDAHYDTLSKAGLASFTKEMVLLEVHCAKLDQSIVEELNACLHITGRVRDFATFLEQKYQDDITSFGL